MTLSLSSAERINLRKAITSHPQWKEARITHGFDIATMGVSALQDAAGVLGINVIEAIKGAQGEIPAPTTPLPIEVPAIPATPDLEPHVSTHPHTPAKASSKAAILISLLGEVMGENMSPERIAQIVDERIQKAFLSIPTLKIEVKGHDGVERHLEGHQHPQAKHLLKMLSTRMATGHAPNIWITGPAASGKSFAPRQAAKAMGADFYVVAKCEGAHDVLGFIDAAGNYHSTGFRRAWEFGGLVLLDEVDAFDAGATLALNGALDGSICAFPDRQVERHADCYVVATANTWGLGANSDYVGRNKLDGAFIDRFHMRLVWQYDVALEIAISGNESWARRVIAARERAKQAAVKVLITPRATQGGAALIAAGYSEDEAAEFTYLANLSKEQRRMVEGA